MNLDVMFFIESLLLGVGLAMDAFSVSLANGLRDNQMPPKRMLFTAGVFAGFQTLMPLIGWVCVHTVLVYFKIFEKCIPFIALGLLSYLGGKMIWEGLHEEQVVCELGEDCKKPKNGFALLLAQGVATSIDALSVGFTIAEYMFLEALLSVFIIGVVTFFICYVGIAIGKKAGVGCSDKATVFGGIILVLIGIEIFITGIL